MNGDRELLELALRAIGEFDNAEWFEREDCFCLGNTAWNPLTDDGDALRLAVKLEITPSNHADTIVPSRSAGWRAGTAHCSLWEPIGNDPYAATRRAIVRAAAEIGKAMP